MPLCLAFQTNIFLAVGALNLCSFWFAFNDTITSGQRAVLQIRILSDLIVSHEFFEFLESVCTDIFIDILTQYLSLAIVIWAFNSGCITIRYHRVKISFQALLAEIVTTFEICYVFLSWKILIANCTFECFFI